MLSKPVQIALVDDHTLFRKTLKNFLSEEINLHVLVQAGDMRELLSKLRNTPVDVLIMDIFLPGSSGIDALKAIRLEFPEIRIVVLSMSTDGDVVGEMLDSGIHAFLSKADEPEELLRAIQAAANGRIYRNNHFTEALYRSRQYRIQAYGGEAMVRLSEREQKMIQLIWEEKSNKEIADELFLGVRSVEKLRQDLKDKLGVKSTVGMLKYAINKKIIRAGSPDHGFFYQQGAGSNS